MIRFGPTELLLILGIIIILFGVGRVGKIGGELGTAIRQFREGLQSSKDEKKAEAEEKQNGPSSGS